MHGTTYYNVNLTEAHVVLGVYVFKLVATTHSLQIMPQGAAPLAVGPV
jgi:hypothetical protein